VPGRHLPIGVIKRAGHSIELAFPAIRTVEVSTKGTGFGAVDVEQVGNFRFIAGFSFGVMQRRHAVTLKIGRWGIQRDVAG
jgi:hypothetical protein